MNDSFIELERLEEKVSGTKQVTDFLGAITAPALVIHKALVTADTKKSGDFMGTHQFLRRFVDQKPSAAVDHSSDARRIKKLETQLSKLQKVGAKVATVAGGARKQGGKRQAWKDLPFDKSMVTGTVTTAFLPKDEFHALTDLQKRERFYLLETSHKKNKNHKKNGRKASAITRAAEESVDADESFEMKPPAKKVAKLDTTAGAPPVVDGASRTAAERVIIAKSTVATAVAELQAAKAAVTERPDAADGFGHRK